MKRLYSIGTDELSSYELKNADRLNPVWFVYFYENYGYEGSGFAVWKKDKKFYYTELGHCSCYGPLEDLDSIAYNSLKEIEKISKKYKGGEQVINFIKEKKWKN